MVQVTTTLKIKFLNLNKVKAKLFAEMTRETTRLANELLKVDLPERRKITTARLITSLKSAPANQVIRHSTSLSGKRTKNYKVLPPEINRQNWHLVKKGVTYSVSFPTIKGIKRVPLAVESSHWQPILDRLLAGDSTIKQGFLKLIRQRGKWYALIYLVQDVPVRESPNRVGVDRGQNNIAVVAGVRGFGKFFKGAEINHRRRYHQQRQQQLQKAKKFRALKKAKKKETKWMESVNHTISRRLVRFAQFKDADIVLEDFSGSQKKMKQSEKLRFDNGQIRHSWAFSDLEGKIIYKMQLKGRRVIKVPHPYTSKTCSHCGRLGSRKKHHFFCPDGHQQNADFNAARNLAQWEGFSCNFSR